MKGGLRHPSNNMGDPAQNRVVGAFPDGNSALMLVCARLRHVASTTWGTKRYMSMKYLDDAKIPDSNPVAG